MEHELTMRDEALALGLLSRNPTDRDRWRFSSFVLLDAFVYPTASLHDLDVGGAYNQWLHFIDDQYDDHAQVGRDLTAVQRIMDRALAILERGTLPDGPTPFDRFTLRLRERLTARASRAWTTRFLADVRSYLLDGSLVALARWNVAARTPTVDEYLPIRLLDSSVLTVFDVMEIIRNVDLPEAIFDHPRLRTMRLAAAYHIIFVNDMVSYHKEVVERGSACNLVHVLMVQERLDYTEASLRVKELADDELIRFLEARAALPPEIARERSVLRYVDGLRDWISGNVDFSVASPRFRWPFQQ
jgi:hypothetical protein